MLASAPVTTRTFTTSSAAETQALAARLGATMNAGHALALVGPLGSGKTTFAQGLAGGLGVAPDRHVGSPTFSLVNEHPGRVPFLHADLYRLEDARELAELGLDEAFDHAAAALEWADRFPGALPPDHLEVRLAATADGGRTITMTAHGPQAARLLAAL